MTIDRRDLLLVGAGFATIAGCSSNTESEPESESASNSPENGSENSSTQQDDNPKEDGADAEPANFTVSNLSVTPSEIEAGTDVSVSVRVVNSGGETGKHTVKFRIDGELRTSRTVELSAGEQTTVAFTPSLKEPGSYTVTIGELEGTITVATQPELEIGDLYLESIADWVADGYLEAEVQNVSVGATGRVTLTARWFNDSGRFIGEDEVFLPTLDAGETWRARVIPTSTDFENIADYEVSGKFETSRGHPVEELEVVESRFDAENQKITTQVENSRKNEVRFVSLHGLVYDTEGRVIGGGTDMQSSVTPGEDLFFEVNLGYALTVYGDDAVVENQAVLVAGGSNDTVTF